MSYDGFVKAVNSLIGKSSNGVSVEFSCSNGKYCASFSNGTMIFGSMDCARVSVRWGKK